MIVRNKVESYKRINELGLNKFPEQLFRENESTKVKEFLESNKAEYYAIRDRSKVGGVLKLKVDYDKVLEEIVGYNIFSINVSSINYQDNQLIAGEICFLSNNEVYAILTFNKDASVRDARENPSLNLKTDIFDKTNLERIPHFDYIYNYIVTNHLEDVIIEFALFDKEVGIKRERIIIYELRTEY